MALFIKGGGGKISITSSGLCKVFPRYEIANVNYVSVCQRILYLEHRQQLKCPCFFLPLASPSFSSPSTHSFSPL